MADGTPMDAPAKVRDEASKNGNMCKARVCNARIPALACSVPEFAVHMHFDLGLCKAYQAKCFEICGYEVL